MLPPPDVLPLLTGICACGCGQPTPIAKATRPNFDQYLGYPMRYLHGHNARLLRAGKTSRWKGGRVNHLGYVRLYRPEHSMADSVGYVLEHRLVMSEILGRPLTDDEHVHHKNGNRSDNRAENLELVVKNAHFIGQRAVDLVKWARDVLARYANLPDA